MIGNKLSSYELPVFPPMVKIGFWNRCHDNNFRPILTKNGEDNCLLSYMLGHTHRMTDGPDYNTPPALAGEGNNITYQ